MASSGAAARGGCGSPVALPAPPRLRDARSAPLDERIPVSTLPHAPATPRPTAATAGAPRPRLVWADAAKGLCILLVVLHHSTVKHLPAVLPADLSAVGEAWLALTAALKPIRMPLFFLLSGLFAAGALRRPWAQVLTARVLTPYWVYAVWLGLLAVVFSLERTLVMNRTQGVGDLAGRPGVRLDRRVVPLRPGGLLPARQGAPAVGRALGRGRGGRAGGLGLGPADGRRQPRGRARALRLLPARRPAPGAGAPAGLVADGPDVGPARRLRGRGGGARRAGRPAQRRGDRPQPAGRAARRPGGSPDLRPPPGRLGRRRPRPPHPPGLRAPHAPARRRAPRARSRGRARGAGRPGGRTGAVLGGLAVAAYPLLVTALVTAASLGLHRVLLRLGLASLFTLPETLRPSPATLRRTSLRGRWPGRAWTVDRLRLRADPLHACPRPAIR